MSDRWLLLDSLRGIALVFMVVYHGAYDLAVFFAYNLDYKQGIWPLVQLASAGMFIFVSGWTAELTGSRGILRKIFLGAVFVSLVTYFIFPQAYVRFGILHLLFTLRWLHRIWLGNLSPIAYGVMGIGALILGNWAGNYSTVNNYGLIFNLTSNLWESVDYYPLIPWSGFFFLGCACGRIPLRKRSPDWLTKINRHSFTIYLLHQPIILFFYTLFTMRFLEFFKGYSIIRTCDG